MTTYEKECLNYLITQAEENCKPFKRANISTLFEEYWHRFSNPKQTPLQNVEVRIIRQYITHSGVEYTEALQQTLKSQIELAKRESKEAELEAKRRYQTLIDIITYK